MESGGGGGGGVGGILNGSKKKILFNSYKNHILVCHELQQYKLIWFQ